MTNNSNKRKFLVTSITATMVAAAVAPVAGFAATPASFPDVPADHAYAGAITDMAKANIIKGMPNGNFDLGGKITRSQAAQMVAGLLDLKTGEEANATDFTDVKGNVWYTGAINSLVAKKIVAGQTTTTFAPDAKITRGELAVLLVKAYGLEKVNVDNVELPFTDVAEGMFYEESIKILHSQGLIKGQSATKFAPKEDMKRGDFAWLSANVDYVHGEKLPKPVKPVVTATKVASVSATNLKEVVVAFDGTVDATSATDKDKYTLETGTVSSVELLEDGKSVRLTLTGKLANQVANKLTVKNVKAGDKVVSVTDFAFTPIDNTLPTVVEVKNLGTKALKVVFSEPIEKTSSVNYKLDGKSFFGSATQGTREVILTPYDSSALSVGEHTLTVSGAEDYFGLKSLSSEHKFTVVEDKVAPTVLKVEATLEKVVVTFSEEVDPATVSASNVYWKSGDTKMTAVGMKQLASDKYEFDFTGKALPGYETTLFVEGVKDYSANTITETQVKVQAAVDQTRPEVAEVKVDELNSKLITVKFNKAVTAADKKYFTLTNSKGDTVAIKQVTKAVGDSTNKVFVIETYNALAGVNTLKVSGIRDMTTLQNTMLDYSTTVSVGDQTAPEYAGISASNAKRQIIIAFNEKMDLASLANPSNYLITMNGNVRTLPAGTDLTPVQDGKAVLVTLPAKYGTTDITFPTASAAGTVTAIQVMGVKDVAGNILKNFSKTVNVMESVVALQAYDTDIDATKEAAQTAKGTVKVRFSQPIGKAVANDFTVTGGNNVSIASVTTNGTEYVTLNLTGSDLTTSTNFGITVKSDNAIESVTGNRTAVAAVNVNINDLVSPVVKLATGVTTLTAVGNKITLPFSETLGGTDSNYKYDLVVTDVATGKVVPTSKINTTRVAVAGANTAIQIEIVGATGSEYTVLVNNDAAHIVDTAGNFADGSGTYGTLIGAVDGISPTLVSAEAFSADSSGDINVIKVTFSEPVNDSSFDNAKFVGYPVNSTLATVAGDVPNDNVVYLTLTTPITGTATSATKLTLTAAAIEDLVGNVSAADSTGVALTDKVAASVKTKLSAAGTFTSAVSQTLVYSEELSVASKAAVKAAVDAAYSTTGTTATVSSAWGTGATANTLTVTSGGTVDSSNTIVSSSITPIAVTDLAGNTSSALAVQ